MMYSGHGGSCCGRKHIFGMSGETTDSIRLLMNANNLLSAGTNKLTEIIISEENGEPEEVDALRDEIIGAGFVKIAEWDNCSGTLCEMFLHANDVTYFPNGAPARSVERNIPAAPAVPVELFRIGQRVENSQGEGGVFASVHHLDPRGNRTHIRVRRERDGALVDWLRAQVRPVQERRVIRAQFHNVLRGVRSEAGWPSIESARAAAPRARRIDRCDIYNDGSVEYHEDVR